MSRAPTDRHRRARGRRRRGVARLRRPVGHRRPRSSSSRSASSSASCSCCGWRTGRRCRCRTRYSWCSRRRSTRRSTRRSSSAPSSISAVLRSPTRSSGWRIRIIVERIVVAAATIVVYDAVRARDRSRRDGGGGAADARRGGARAGPGRSRSAVAPAAPADVLAAGPLGVARDRVVGNAHGDRLPRCRRSRATSASGGRCCSPRRLLAAWYAFERLDSATRRVPADDRGAGDGARVRRHRAARSLATGGGAVVGDGRRARRLGHGHLATSRWPRCCTTSARSRIDEPEDADARSRRRRSRRSRARCCARSSRSRARATSWPATRDDPRRRLAVQVLRVASDYDDLTARDSNEADVAIETLRSAPGYVYDDEGARRARARCQRGPGPGAGPVAHELQ